MAKNTTPAVVRHDLSNKDGEYAVSYKRNGEERKKVFGEMFLDVPLTLDGLRDAFSDYKTKIGDVEITGLEAAAARQFIQMAETVRGAIRDRLAKGEVLSDADAQAEFDAWSGPGRSAPRVVKVAETDLAAALALPPEQRADALRKLGISVK